jgi:hypothetical protein
LFIFIIVMFPERCRRIPHAASCVAVALLLVAAARPMVMKELPFFFDLYTFRGDHELTSVVAAVAVPREKLNLSDIASQRGYRMDLSLIVIDTLLRKVVREDDSVSVTKRRISSDDLFRLHVAVDAPASRNTVQRLIVSDPSEPGIGRLAAGPFPVPDYTGSQLMLSDIVLADPKVEGHWRRGNVTLALLPTRHFHAGTFDVFYEVYNIANEARYSTEIEIQPSQVRVRFEGAATNVRKGTMQELRHVKAPLKPGRYRMRITVRNLDTGEMARRDQTFVIPD